MAPRIRSTARPTSRITGTTDLTDPFDDPESYYWNEAGWRGLGPLWRAVVHAQTTLLGRIVFGPAFVIGRFVRDLARDAWRDKPGARAMLGRHLLECAPVLFWVVAISRMPLWLYFACFIYPGASLAMVRSFAEHRAAPEAERRTAIVEGAWILGPLFLFNNLHAAHHLRHRLPWYQIPKFYRLNRSALIERNGGLVYRGYLDVAWRYLVKPHDKPDSPRLGAARGVSGRALIAVLPMYDFPWTAEANDALWAAMAARLDEAGVEAPKALTRGPDLDCAMARSRPRLRPDLRLSLCDRTKGRGRADRGAGSTHFLAARTPRIEASSSAAPATRAGRWRNFAARRLRSTAGTATPA